MIQACGSNGFFQLGVKSNNKSPGGVPVCCPPINLNLDPSTISSFSNYSGHTVYTTFDGKAFGIGCNEDGRISKSLELDVLNKFTIIDLGDEKCHAISAVCGELYTLYLVSIDGENILLYSSYNTQLKYPVLLDIEKSVTKVTSLYGGCVNAAAIDDKGSILFIGSSAEELERKTLEKSILPGSDEKAVCVACCNDFIFVLSQNGHVFVSPVNSKSLILEFVAVDELNNVDIVQISGTFGHCIAVSREGSVFVRGKNHCGCLGIGKEGDEFDKFTLISSLENYKITNAFAGYTHSLFMTCDGKIIACGLSNFGEMPVGKMPGREIFPIIETSIENGAASCIAGYCTSFFFIGCDAIHSPNRRIGGVNDDPEKIAMRVEIATLSNENDKLKQQIVSLKKKLGMKT